MKAYGNFETELAADRSLADIDLSTVAWFVHQVRQKREDLFASDENAASALNYLNLVDEDVLLNAAFLLFGRRPQQIAPSAVVKCAFYHGVTAATTIPSQQEIGGNLFQQVEGARDFVLSRVRRSVGARESSANAAVQFEVPPGAVAELVINAVTHRDYNDNGSVQVTVYADRIEVINPGHLPEGLTVAGLLEPHTSRPRNPFLARALYLAGYIEQIGVGITRVVDACRSARLPVPTFEQRDNQFMATLWRDLFPPDVLESFGVTERQAKGVAAVKQHGSIANATYQEVAGVSRKTASRDLDHLVKKGVLVRVGERRGTRYVLASSK